MKRRSTLIPLLILTLLLSPLASCTLGRGDAPLFGPTPTPSLSPTPTLTLTPTPTPTPIPTPTPVPAARIQSGQRAMMDGDYDKALGEFQIALTFSSDPEVDTAALLGLGRTYLLQRNYPEAARSFGELVQGYPDSPQTPDAYFFLGQAQAAQDNYFDAADAYLNYLTHRSGVVDAYVLNLRGDALFAAGDYGGAANDFRAAVQSPSLLDTVLLQMKTARASALSGDSGTALAMYDDLYYRTENDYTRALIDLRKGQVYEAQGKLELAHTAYLDAVQNYPRAYESYSALLVLVEAGTPVNELDRGLVDYFAGQYGVAMAAFDRYLQNAPTDPGTAYYYYGMAWRAQGGNQEAVDMWNKLIEGYPDHRLWDEAYEQKAYTQWAFLDQYPEAVQTLLEFVEKAPGHARAAEYLFDAAQVAERDGELQQAADLWERVINLYSSDERAMRALFLAGIAYYRMENYQGALGEFQRYQGLALSLFDRAMSAFWVGKVQAAMGDAAAAQATWQTAASIDPTGYYSERARDMLYNRTPFTPPQVYDLAVDAQAEHTRAEEWMRTTFSLQPDTDLSGLGPLANEPYLIRGQELWQLGLYDDARAEFEALRLAYATDPLQSYRLANYLTSLGMHRSSVMAARQVLNQALMDDAMSISAPAYFNHLRFGTYYSNMILPLAQMHDFHPLFLFSVVRQESLFEGFVSSSADARGLMQVIPATGQEIYSNLGWPANYSPEDLYRPLVSLTYGVEYLDRQRKNFDGDLYAALAAYNGGPGNASQWKELAPNDPDLFLEVIRYDETRNYIRGIFEIFALYRVIYNRTP